MLAPSAEPSSASSATAVVTAEAAVQTGDIVEVVETPDAAETAEREERAETANGILKFPGLKRKGPTRKAKNLKGKTEEKCQECGRACIGKRIA